MSESLYELSAEAQDDLFEIWHRIAADSVILADRIEGEFTDLFELPGRMPTLGHTRRDLTVRTVLFFPLYSFLIAYQPDTQPTRIVAVLRGKRNLKKLLKYRD